MAEIESKVKAIIVDILNDDAKVLAESTAKNGQKFIFEKISKMLTFERAKI